MVYAKFVLPGLSVMVLFLSGCLGKTAPVHVYFISPKKKKVFVAPPINHTDQFLLDQRIRDRIKGYFSSETRFAIVEDVDESDLYVLVSIDNYSAQGVNDYGFGNYEITLRAGLSVSDTKYRDRIRQDEEQTGRYYYKEFPLTIELLDYLEVGDTHFTLERLENLVIDRTVLTIHELMLSGRFPKESLLPR